MSKGHIQSETVAKGIAACVILAASLGILTQTEYSTVKKTEAVLGEPSGMNFTAGSYTASAQGCIGDVTVTVTFDETMLTDVVIDASGETPEIGGAAVEELCANLLLAQSSEIDGVTGATMTSDAVREAVADCISLAIGE